jgi:thermostable 8-oxoguanine DNA glycosylase
MFATFRGEVQRLCIPASDDELLPGITWGAFDEFFTPAFWRGQAWQHQQLGTYANVRIGDDLVEEVAACLLGGFGMPAELGIAAFTRLRQEGLLVYGQSASVLEKELSRPLMIRGHVRTYRFPRQKARYLAASLQKLSDLLEPKDDVALRDCLTALPGVGLKTASWIVRNYRNSDSVAVIDLHIVRACQHIRLFPAHLDPNRHYRALEQKFLKFADAIHVPAKLLDALIWDYMSRLSAMRLQHAIPHRRSSKPRLMDEPVYRSGEGGQ